MKQLKRLDHLLESLIKDNDEMKKKIKLPEIEGRTDAFKLIRQWIKMQQEIFGDEE